MSRFTKWTLPDSSSHNDHERKVLDLLPCSRHDVATVQVAFQHPVVPASNFYCKTLETLVPWSDTHMCEYGERFGVEKCQDPQRQRSLLETFKNWVLKDEFNS